jgi:acetylornithine deacetylase/succinyl-diaminopimelate desuccinylase-like protein
MTALATDRPRQLARDLLADLVAIDTTHSRGSTTLAAEAVKHRLLEAGFPAESIRIVGPDSRKCNLVARLRGTGAARPLLLLAHLDVVEADPEEWTTHPFELAERDGYFYGRGTLDDKGMAALWIAILIRLVEQGIAPDRDIIVALTADEEGGDDNGAEYLLTHHPELVEAELGLNEGGYGRIQNGRRIANQIQASEKIPVFFELRATADGGHSSLPLPDTATAIGRVTRALVRIAGHRFPSRLDSTTRAFFERMADLTEGPAGADMRALLLDPADEVVADRLSENPYYHGLLRTTCMPTRLEAGTGDNVLPSQARATVDCRILPGTDPGEIASTLRALLSDLRIEVTPRGDPNPSPASPLTPMILDTVETVTAEIWPGVPVLPVMTIGATDSSHFRRAGIPMYGVSGLFLDFADIRAHAPDERIGVQEFYDAGEFLFRLVTRLASGRERLADSG